ncbi:MAG: hypothetical protein RLN90_02580 [Balneolaceae bacterium]
MNIKTKAASFWWLAFSISFATLFVACENPGSIGSEFIEKSEINVDTIQVSNLIESNQDAYLGRLSRSAIGRFQDGLAGEIEAISFFKPSIQRSSDTLIFDDNTNLSLRLQLYEDEVYGDTSSTGTYSIYRVSSSWRGSTFRNSSDIIFDEGELIGQFSDATADTNGIIYVELTGSWKDDYINFFNMADDTRDEAYKAGDFGLAVIPDAGNSKIVYANYTLSNLTSFDSDTTSRFILDWGVDIDRTGEVDNPERIILDSNFDKILRFNLAEIADQIGNKNFARVAIEFKIDTLALSSSLADGEVRSSALGMSLKFGPLSDIPFDLGFGSLEFSTVNNNGFYRFNLTGLLNNYLYGEASVSDAYVYLTASSGSLAYTSIYLDDSNPENNPKLIVYGIEGEE